MKKIINNIPLIAFCSFSLLASSCSNKKEREEKDRNADSTLTFSSIIGVGKVVPADGWLQISSPITASVAAINVQEGDTVSKGQLLVQLREDETALDAAQAQATLESLRATHQSQVEDLQREEISLKQLREKYETSNELYRKNAETRENLELDLANYQQQEKRVSSLRKQLLANRATEKEQQLSIDKARLQQKDFTVLAPDNGIITDLSVEVGQSVNANTMLGQMVKNELTIIEAEIDELFADSVAVGQQVTINPIGKNQVIAKGIVRYVSPTLVNKSIFFETANEAEDRRIRRIKVEPTGGNLLINSKVEVKIQLR